MPEPAVRAPLTRPVVIDAARSLIERDGLDALSLRQVAQALGVTAPALYAYVEGKRDLLRGVAEIAFDELTARFAAIDEDDVVNRVRALSYAYVAFAVERPELFRTMFLFPPELPVVAPTGEELPAATKAFQVSLTAIEEAIATGRFAPTEPVAAGMTVWTVTHGAATVLLMGFGVDDATARDALVTNAIEAAIRGLSAGDT